MVTHPNFYENIQEALLRLRGTIVMYDGEPMYIWTITDHKEDGSFRVYMSEIDKVSSANFPCLNTLPHGHAAMGPQMDQYVEGAVPSSVPLLRKKMDSKHFNKFRPFPLGMMNVNGDAVYVQRRPLRPKTEQGLTPGMLEGTRISACMTDKTVQVSAYCSEFKDCIKGDYPSPNQCLQGMTSDTINRSAAFHRSFALVRGPIETLFLAYKADIVGSLENRNFSRLKLGRKFKHLKEVTQELRLFSIIE